MQKSKGSGKLEVQIERLIKKIGEGSQDKAQELIDTFGPDLIKLAAKLCPKGARKSDELGKREIVTYDELINSVGQDAADKWKQERLAAKAK
jgi:hypothetical protein